MQIILSTPLDLTTDQLLPLLTQAVETGLVSALIVSKGELTDQQYENTVRALAPVTQKNNCAVLLDNLPQRVRELEVDGVHMTTGQTKFAAAIADLKPDFIVGAGDLSSRHETMLRGENSADYVLFGDFDRDPTPEDIELADWGADMLEVPTALLVPLTSPDDLGPLNTEFVALGDNVWQAEQGPEMALRMFDKLFESNASDPE